MKAYKLIETRFNKDINSEISYYEHIKTKARVLVVKNDDPNKVFSIAFRTPPVNDTGVPHILEHSTLCGSKKFPVKDPFVELLKSSLNTFLNAMTYPDKTIYPVASCNDKDFANLMEVYLDAVFYPNVYLHEEIFKQEGWHYELDSFDGEVTYNGVVYNEMKGAFSSSDQVVYRQSRHSCFPDTTYGCESGGDPLHIPELSYKEFCSFHSRYYHPSNSYIYLYGNLDVCERMEYLDREYLSKFDKIETNSEIKEQKPFDKVKYETYYFPVGKEESLKDRAYYTYNAVIGHAGDNLLANAFGIISYVLFDAPGAPLKQALIDAGIGKDISSSFDTGTLQPVFSIWAKDAQDGKAKEFEDLINNELKKIVKNGIDKESILAAINFLEFQKRENDFGSYPKGLVYNLTSLDNWLYDDSDPFSALEVLEIYKVLKEKVNSNFYEELVEKYLILNTHKSIVSVLPSHKIADEQEKLIKEKLAAFKASLSKEEIEELIASTKALKEYQATPSSKEELATLPKLTREDIGDGNLKYINELKNVDGIKCINHDIFTNGINYLKLDFDVSHVPNDLMPYVGLLSETLGLMDTKNMKYADIAMKTMANTGGISFDTSSINIKNDEAILSFSINAKYLDGKEDFVFNLIDDVIKNTIFDNKKRLQEIIAEVKSRRQASLTGRGHTVSANRALSYFNLSAFYDQTVDGIGFYQFVENLNENFEDLACNCIEMLKKACSYVFRKENLRVSYTAKNTNYEKYLTTFASNLYSAKIDASKFEFKPLKLNEGFKTSTSINYSSLVLNYQDKVKYDGSLQVFSVALQYDYLWNKIRVLGGAYGAMQRISRDGYIMLSSYRDPKLKETYETYKGIVDFIDNMNYNDEDITKFIISAIGNIDTPMSPSTLGNVSYIAFLKGLTEDDLALTRKEIVSTTLESLKNASIFFKEGLKDSCLCTIGNEKMIEENKELFGTTLNLFK